MKIYRVGGSVRDELLGLPVTDHDYVVVGATPEAMLAEGYKPVGRDFPVFLHPETHEEYALARTERKHGRGHQGFLFHADPDVSLESDLLRRDLTINAMARGDDGSLIDPYGGERDLAARTLRHVSPAFAEDPLRVLRVARFSARFGFEVAPETEALMRSIVAQGELAELSPERVWREFGLGLVAAMPSRMLAVLRRCGALQAVAPEIDKLFATAAEGPQPDLGVLTALALDNSARRLRPAPPPLAVQFGIAARWMSIAQAQSLAARLRAGNECRDAAVHAARFAGVLEHAARLDAEGWLKVLGGVDAQRRPERLSTLAAVIAAWSPDADGARQDIEALAGDAMRALGTVDYSALAAGDAGAAPAEQARALRMRALESWISARRTTRRSSPGEGS